MATYHLTLNQSWTAINALHTAAEAYESFAEETITMHTLAKQFRRQAQQALDLAALIEEVL